jgi:hypothetical protein
MIYKSEIKHNNMYRITNPVRNIKLKWYLFSVLFTIGLILESPSVSAQQIISLHPAGYTAEKQAEKQTGWMVKVLDLPANYAKAVYQINLKYLLQRDSLRSTPSADKVDRRILHQAITQKKNAELQTALTPELYNKYVNLFTNAKRHSR